MERFCIIINRSKETAYETACQIAEYLKQQGRQAVLVDCIQEANGQCRTDAAMFPPGIEAAVVLGGDGTILQAAHDLLNTKIPILGINMGTLGFLAETELSEVKQAFEALFTGCYEVEERMMLSVRILRNEQECILESPLCALNDAVITRTGFSRLIGVGIFVNGALVNDYRGDGVILATPTGSTGYNLSAGGPVVTPKAELILITPICPHTLNARSIVVSSEDEVEIRIRESKKTQEEEAILTVDGMTSVRLHAKDRIFVRRFEGYAKLIRFKEKNFFDILRTKIGSGGSLGSGE